MLPGGTLNAPDAFTLQIHHQSPRKVLDNGILIYTLTCCSQARESNQREGLLKDDLEMLRLEGPQGASPLSGCLHRELEEKPGKPGSYQVTGMRQKTETSCLQQNLVSPAKAQRLP